MVSTACLTKNVPHSLIVVPQWVGWRLEEIDGKIKKIPYSPNGGRANVADPNTWSDFKTACSVSQEQFHGCLGFVFTKEDDFAAMDIDDCRNPETGEITPKARYIIEMLNSYTEISPSGTGVHILVRVGYQQKGKKQDGFEMYHYGRYFTVTGNQLPGTPDEIAYRDEEFAKVYKVAFPEELTHALSLPAKQHALTLVSTQAVELMSDEEVLDKASRAINGDKFSRLYKDGDLTEHFGDDSAADLALCRILAFWCGRDGREQIERLFSKSALAKREKWETREDYREWTIQKALTDQSEFYGDRSGGFSVGSATQEIKDTERGNAKRLARLFGHEIRYVREQKKWAVWGNGRWRIGDADLVKMKAAKTVDSIYQEAIDAQGPRRQELLGHAKRSDTKHGIDAMVDLLRTEDNIIISAEELDAKPWLLNVANGTIDLRTGKLQEASRHDLLTAQVPIHYDPDAKCPEWEKFLERVVPSAETRSFLQRSVGYSLTGIVREHAIFFLYGEGKNGKSTFTTVIEALLGDMWTKTRSDVLMVSRFGATQGATPDLAKLKGKRLVTITEIGAGARLNEALIKDMTGGDRISARELYSDPITFNATHKLWMYGNHKPDIRGTDTGIWRRVKLIPFHETITQEECDPMLGVKLAMELAGIMNWGLEGCLSWQDEGLGEPAEVEKATQEYRDEMDIVGQFLSVRCEDKPGCSVGSTALFEAYKQYCTEQGEFYKTQKMFSQTIKDRGYVKGRMSGGHMTFEGLRLIDIAGNLNKMTED